MPVPLPFASAFLCPKKGRGTGTGLALFIYHVIQTGNRHHVGSHNQHPFAIALDAGGLGCRDIILARCIGVSQIVQISILKLEVRIVHALKSAYADEGAAHVDDNLLTDEFLDHDLLSRG